MDWEDLFQNHILERGIDYYIRNLVDDVSIDDNIIEATVYGTEEYHVYIDIEYGEITHMDCSCPYALDGNHCKHMAAVLYYVDSKKDNGRNIKPNMDQIIREDIVKLIDKADEDIVKSFLADILEDNVKTLNRFKRILSYEISPTDIKGYKNQIDDIFRGYAGRDDFINYHNARYFILELEEFLVDVIQVMVDNEYLKEAFELTSYIFIKIGNQDMDDSDGGTGDIVGICLETWHEILERADLKLKWEMFNWFVDNLDGSVIDYMEEYLKQTIFENFKEKEFLEYKLRFIDNKIGKYKKREYSWSTNYNIGNLVMYRISILNELEIDKKIIEEYYKDNLEFSIVRESYIDYCIQAKDYNTAIQVLKEGKKMDKNFPGLVLNYSLNLKELYKKIGDRESYKKELWSLVLEYKPGDLGLYKELKSLYTDTEWLEKREIIFNKINSKNQIDKLYKIEGLHDRLLEIVLSSQGLYMLYNYEKDLKDKYPNELLQKYQTIVQDMATHTSDRGRYREIVSILRRMKKYPEGKERVIEIIKDWKVKYRNRPAMMDELNKL